MLLGAGLVGVGLMFGLGYVLPAFSFSMKLTVSIASASTVLLLAYGIDRSTQAAYKEKVHNHFRDDYVSSREMGNSANVANVSVQPDGLNTAIAQKLSNNPPS